MTSQSSSSGIWHWKYHITILLKIWIWLLKNLLNVSLKIIFYKIKPRKLIISYSVNISIQQLASGKVNSKFTAKYPTCFSLTQSPYFIGDRPKNHWLNFSNIQSIALPLNFLKRCAIPQHHNYSITIWERLFAIILSSGCCRWICFFKSDLW